MTRNPLSWLAMAVTAAALVACNSLIDVSTTDRVPAETLDNPANAALMVNSAIGDFECAVGSYILVQAIISDEFSDAQLGAAAWPYDRRDANTQPGGIYGTSQCDNNQNPGVYTPLSTARFTADNALAKLEGWTDQQVPNRGALKAKAALYAGFSYSLMGMAMCEAAFDLQAPIDQPAMFARAEDRFTTAITEAAAVAGLQSVVNAALVGRARVRLFRGDLTGAAADAQLVPAGFVLNASVNADANRRVNRVFSATTFFGFYTVDAQSRALQTGPGLDATGAVPDPRAAAALMTTRAADPTQDIWAPTKYGSLGTPIPVARYEEAQLILAEAQGGANAVTIIDALRDAYSLPHYTGPTDAASITQLVAAERRRALFVEGFRNYDIQRFSLPLIPAPGTVYPDKGGSYGNTTCLPLPDIERFNNPNASASR